MLDEGRTCDLAGREVLNVVAHIGTQFEIRRPWSQAGRLCVRSGHGSAILRAATTGIVVPRQPARECHAEVMRPAQGRSIHPRRDLRHSVGPGVELRDSLAFGKGRGPPRGRSCLHCRMRWQHAARIPEQSRRRRRSRLCVPAGILGRSIRHDRPPEPLTILPLRRSGRPQRRPQRPVLATRPDRHRNLLRRSVTTTGWNRPARRSGKPGVLRGPGPNPLWQHLRQLRQGIGRDRDPAMQNRGHSTAHTLAWPVSGRVRSPRLGRPVRHPPPQRACGASPGGQSRRARHDRLDMQRRAATPDTISLRRARIDSRRAVLFQPGGEPATRHRRQSLRPFAERDRRPSSGLRQDLGVRLVTPG